MSYQTMEWIDGAAGGTPVNAENLNNMIDGIDEALSCDIGEDRIEDGAVTWNKLGSSIKSMLNNFDTYKLDRVVISTAITSYSGLDVCEDGYTYYIINVSGALATALGVSGNAIVIKVGTTQYINFLSSNRYFKCTFENVESTIEEITIADYFVTYSMLSQSLREKVDTIPDNPIFREYKGELSSTTALNSSSYCVGNGIFQFIASPPLSTAIGCGSGKEVELRCVNGYQVITQTDNQQIFLRKINTVAPTFSAGDWVEISDTESGSISSTAISPSGSTKTISGTYSLNGDYCTITAQVGTDSGATSMQYSLPVAAIGTATTIGIGAGFRSFISSSNSTVTIQPFNSGETFIGTNVYFTLTYKYR